MEQPELNNVEMVKVHKFALVRLLVALNGAPHFIQEMIHTRKIDSIIGAENPIDVLMNDLSESGDGEEHF